MEVDMKRTLILLGLSFGALSLTGCTDGTYYSGGLYMGDIAYDGYYDNYYGPIYDGYWGTDNYFYYRHSDQDRSFRRGDRNHFMRGRERPSEHFYQMHGITRPPEGSHAPHFPTQNRKGGHRDDGHNPR
jgi:hypothetical protein